MELSCPEPAETSKSLVTETHRIYEVPMAELVDRLGVSEEMVEILLDRLSVTRETGFSDGMVSFRVETYNVIPPESPESAFEDLIIDLQEDDMFSGED